MSWSAERFLELHRKIRSKLCTEVFGHIMAVIVFAGLVIITVVDVLKQKQRDHDPDLKKLVAAILGIFHFGLCATAILYLKYLGVVELCSLKCKVWIYLEVYNIAATTTFIVLATRHLLPRPFHEWFGTAFLLLVYWLPLVMCKTSQICKMLEFISLLTYLHDSSLSSMQKTPLDKAIVPTTVAHSTGHHHPHHHHRSLPPPCPGVHRAGSFTRIIPRATQLSPTLPTFHTLTNVPKPLSASSPHIPYEWALIESMNTAYP